MPLIYVFYEPNNQYRCILPTIAVIFMPNADVLLMPLIAVMLLSPSIILCMPPIAGLFMPPIWLGYGGATPRPVLYACQLCIYL